MNDRYDAGYEGQYELVGYDEYGQPVYRQVPPQQPQQQPYDPYAQQTYGYDPYAPGQQQPAPAYDPYGTGQQPAAPEQGGGYDSTGTYPAYDAYDPYGQTAAVGQQQPQVAEQTAYIPQQAGPPDPVPDQQPGTQDTGTQDSGARAPREDRDYRTEQFAFVEEPDGDSEDVIDWLAFTENRTERREEAKRRARGRLIAVVVALAVFVAGGVGYLWWAGELPGVSSSDDSGGGTTTAGAQKRDVIVVHLHDTKGGATSTALLVDNTTTKQGTTVLLPNALALTGDDGATTLTKSVEDDGSSGTREALDTALGTSIQGTWRLDTPYLQNLVDLVGNIEVDTNADVPDPDADEGAAPLVRKGTQQTLSGKTAVAYATYKASGETQEAQLERFGQVMQSVLRKMSSDPQAATTTVQTLAQILDPSLTDNDLGAFLAALSDLAKSGDYKTELLPVETDGTLNAQASAGVVKDVLGGTAENPDDGTAVRVSVQNATGVQDRTEDARVTLLNGGFTFLEGGTASAAEATTEITYADDAEKENATEVAKTLGLPTEAVTKGEVSSNADVTVILGQDYEPAGAS
ncbi:LytR C-terminal domain-containing protein [Streptomyces sp. NPDC059477]|uniref:LCP family protein n=1 Tax=Streptomyces sp. NPDC059477 TaxID=3346847 RepID=UPI00368FE1F5